MAVISFIALQLCAEAEHLMTFPYLALHGNEVSLKARLSLLVAHVRRIEWVLHYFSIAGILFLSAPSLPGC
jgi:uncharacterized membrane protein YciS (DUF1049 family)